MDQERRKIELATEAVSNSYGMIGIFVGLAIIIYVIGNFLTLLFYYRGYGESASFAGIASMLACFGGCVAGYFYFRSYFRRKYGFAAAKKTDIRGSALKWFTVGFAMFLVSKVIGNIDVIFAPPFSATILAFAVLAFIFWQVKYRGISNIFLYFSIILLLVSFLPWNTILDALEQTKVFRDRKDFFGSLFLLLFGIAGIVSGLTDLTILSKTLTPIDREEEVYESV